MSLNLIKVSSKKELNDFISLPWTIYKNDKNWVPPLKMAIKDLLSPKHPFYKTASMEKWIVKKDGKCVGRIAAVINHTSNDFHKENVANFGFYECTNDQEVSNLLFQAVFEYVKDKKVDALLGPFNPSTNYECGLLIEGFDDPPQLMMTYNPPYYIDQFEKQGLTKAKDLLAHKLEAPFTMPEKIVRISKRAMEKSKFSYRKINKKDWNNEVQRMFEIYNSAWEKNWGFIPMTREEFFHTAKDLKAVVDERLIIFAQSEGRDVGFIVTLPDFNQVFKNIPSGKLLPFGILKLLTPYKYVNRMRTITMGLRPEYRKGPLSALLYHKAREECIKLGKFKEGEFSWVLEDNIEMNKPIELMGAKVYKKYRIYERGI